MKTTRLLLSLTISALFVGCAGESDPLGGAAEVAEGFLQAVVNGDAEAAEDFALIEGDSEGFVIFTELLAAGEPAFDKAEVVDYGELRLGEGPYGRDLLTVEVEVQSTALAEERYTIGLVREDGRWYVKDVPWEWSYALE
mgnify:CR=1 FL=1